MLRVRVCLTRKNPNGGDEAWVCCDHMLWVVALVKYKIVCPFVLLFLWWMWIIPLSMLAKKKHEKILRDNNNDANIEGSMLYTNPIMWCWRVFEFHHTAVGPKLPVKTQALCKRSHLMVSVSVNVLNLTSELEMIGPSRQCSTIAILFWLLLINLMINGHYGIYVIKIGQRDPVLRGARIIFGVISLVSWTHLK